MNQIKFNSGIPEYSWLSNFEPAPIVDLNGLVWPSSEHCYAAAKIGKPGDRLDTAQEWREKIRACNMAGQAKKLACKAPIRADWDDLKLEVMRRILVAKFTQNPEFYTLLMDTRGVELIEYALWGDRYWGVDRDGKGQNWLGRLLMSLRDLWLEKPPTTVVNIREVPDAEYIGRAGQGQNGYFGNPVKRGWVCRECRQRHMQNGDTLPCFAKYFHKRLMVEPDFKEAVLQLKGAELGCFCKTKSGVGNPCHGDIISLWLNNYGS